MGLGLELRWNWGGGLGPEVGGTGRGICPTQDSNIDGFTHVSSCAFNSALRGYHHSNPDPIPNPNPNPNPGLLPGVSVNTGSTSFTPASTVGSTTSNFIGKLLGVGVRSRVRIGSDWVWMKCGWVSLACKWDGEKVLGPSEGGGCRMKPLCSEAPRSRTTCTVHATEGWYEVWLGQAAGMASIRRVFSPP